MNNKKFFDSVQCKSGKYCNICRNKDKTAFRNTILQRYDDVDELNFTCPYKKQWGFVDKEDQEKSREEVRERMKILAEHKNRLNANAEKKKEKAILDQKVRKNELIGLNFKYIFQNESIFEKIPGYADEKEKINMAVKKAEEAGKCSNCTRNRLNRTIEKFVIKNLDAVANELPENVLLPLSTPLTIKQYKESKK